jgi:hypothetical protein
MKKIKYQIVLLLLVSSFACTPRSLEKKAAVDTPVAGEEKQAGFETDLQTMRTAGFEYIFVFRRKDGGAFDVEDRKHLRAYSPPETNRFISTDDGKAFIAGSKYKFTPEHLDALRMRFNIEDYSVEQPR